MDKNKRIEILRALLDDAEDIKREVPETMSLVYEEDEEGFAASLHNLWWRSSNLQQRVDRLIKGE